MLLHCEAASHYTEIHPEHCKNQHHSTSIQYPKQLMVHHLQMQISIAAAWNNKEDPGGPLLLLWHSNN